MISTVQGLVPEQDQLAAIHAAALAVNAAERDLHDAARKYQDAGGTVMAAYWVLGQCFRDLDMVLAQQKGKWHRNTPRKQAIEMAGGHARYQVARDVRLVFESEDAARETGKTTTITAIRATAAQIREERRQALGKGTPGRKSKDLAIETVGPMGLLPAGIGDEDPPSEESKDPELQNTETPPSLCEWIHERLTEAGIRPTTILDPCSGRGNLTRSFGSATVIEYEIRRGQDFFDATSIRCDLAICNPPWIDTEQWLRHLVQVVGRDTPIIFLCAAVLLHGDKSGACRRYLESADAPTLNHVTVLPRDTFVKVYYPATILWFNLPAVQHVALVPSCKLVRKND